MLNPSETVLQLSFIDFLCPVVPAKRFRIC